MVKRFVATLLFLAGFLSLPAELQAQINVTVHEVGGSVVFNYSGSANITSLPPLGSGLALAVLEPATSSIFVGGVGPTNTNSYSLLSAPPNFGTGTSVPATTSSGDGVGVAGYLYLPQGYSSGVNISGTATYNGATIASLGMTPGTYTWTWNSGANADSLVLTITAPTPSPAPIPTLSEWAEIMMMFMMIATVGFYGWRTKQR